MDSEEEIFDDSGNESSEESSDNDTGLCLDHLSGRERVDLEEEFVFEVLSTEEIVQHMIDCIKEVNMIVEVLFKVLKFHFIVIIYVLQNCHVPMHNFQPYY